MTEDERLIYEMVLSLSAHQVERGQHQDAFTSKFIAEEIAKGTHRSTHDGWRGLQVQPHPHRHTRAKL